VHQPTKLVGIANASVENNQRRRTVDWSDFESTRQRSSPDCKPPSDFIVEATGYVKELMEEVHKRQRVVHLLDQSLAKQTLRHQNEISYLLEQQELQLQEAMRRFQ